MNWKMWVSMAIPAIRNAGISKKNEDANNTGRDDIIGSSLIYIADLLEAILSDKELPKAPSVLR
ncbi:MAG TPA: hypothetical protein PKY82_02140 [Pyrinomonadaceae bacterium]|nr:hypothetical protein [Pyrinomonadaceae bacterium]